MPRMLNLLENVSGQVDAQEIIQKLPQNIELPKVTSIYKVLSTDRVIHSISYF